MERPGVYERQRLQAVVEKGRVYASERPSVCAELRRRILEADVVPVDDLGRALNAVPPSSASERGRIEYDPVFLARVAADHTYPEWVVSAQLELLIGQRKAEWHGGSRTGLPPTEHIANHAAAA